MTGSSNSTERGYAGGLSRRQFLAIVGLFWLYVTLSNVLYAYSMGTSIGNATTEPLFAPWNMRVLQHALLLPLVLVSFWASLRVQWRPLWVALPLQILLGAAFAAVAYPAMLLSQVLLGGAAWEQHMMGHMSGPFSASPALLAMWLASFVSFLPAYGFGLAMVTGIALYTRVRNSEMRLAALERDWSAARLAALRMQLSPHTLFNLLHTIRGHIDWDPAVAQSMVVQLADLLRRLLSAGERDFSLLSDEFQFVKHYLELQQRRFADRLTVVMPDPGAVAAVWVPSLIMQPLVENAVVHGLAGHQDPVVVRVALEATADRLILRVFNTVVGRAAEVHEGIGIQNVRERLAVHFPGRAALRTERSDSHWTSELVMPVVRDSPERAPVRRALPLVGA
jgi:hypothetical protein